MKDFIEVFVNQFDGKVRANLGCGQKPSPQEKLVRLLVQVPETVKPTVNPIKVYLSSELGEGSFKAVLPNGENVHRYLWVDLKRECEIRVPMNRSFVWAYDQPAWTLRYCPAELLPPAPANPVPTQAPAPDDTASDQVEAKTSGYRLRSKHSVGTGGIITDPEGFVKGFGIGISQLNTAGHPTLTGFCESLGYIYNKPDSRPEVKDQRTLDMILNDGSCVTGKSNRYTWTDWFDPKGVWMWRVSNDDSAPNVPDTNQPEYPQVGFDSISLADKTLQSLVQGFASKFQKHTQVPGSLAKGQFWIIFSDGALVPKDNYVYEDFGDSLAPVYIAERD